MEKYINEYGKECWRGVDNDSLFSSTMFHLVDYKFEDDIQSTLHTNLGSITVLDRMTGFGYRDIETGYRDIHGNFWLASGGYDVRNSDCKTIGEAIEWVKKRANTCNPTILKGSDIE